MKIDWFTFLTHAVNIRRMYTNLKITNNVVFGLTTISQGENVRHTAEQHTWLTHAAKRMMR